MSSFDEAIKVIMAHEGKDNDFYVDDPDDLGGPTVWGWSTLTINKLGLTPRDLGLDQDEFTSGCLQNVTKQRCQELYRTYFWDKYGYQAINDQTIATKTVDAAVNMGPEHAAELAQRAAIAMGQSLVVDGSLGPKSFAAINACDPAGFVQAYADQMTNYYLAIIAKRPKNAKFRSNWMKRAQWGC